MITAKDGTEIYYKDWGKGPVVTFSHGWPLNADAWDGQMHYLVQRGFRTIAHDRRGHGRSSQASSGNDMDGYADDLAAVIETLDLHRRRHGLRSDCCWSIGCDDYVCFSLYEFGDQREKSVSVAVGGANVDFYVLTIDVAKVRKPRSSASCSFGKPQPLNAVR